MDENTAYIIVKGKLLEEGISKAEHEAKFPVSIADGGTGATDAAAARLALGVGPKWDNLYIELPIPDQSFEISVNGDYNAFLIYCVSNVLDSDKVSYSSHVIYLPNAANAFRFNLNVNEMNDDNSAMYFHNRKVSVLKTTDITGTIFNVEFTFGNGYTFDGSTVSANQNVLLPLAIYGTVI